MKVGFISHFFSSETPRLKRLSFWVNVGPFFMALSFAFIAFQSARGSVNSLIAALLGIIFCSKWKMKGFFGALLILFTATLWEISHASSFSMSTVALNLSLAVSLYIIAHSQSEVSEMFLSYSDDMGLLIDQIRELKSALLEEKALAGNRLVEANESIESFKTEIEMRTSDVESLKKLLQVTKNEIAQLASTNEKLVHDLQNKTGSLAVLQLQIAALKEQVVKENEMVHTLNEVRVENYQLSLLQDAYQQEKQSYESQLKMLKGQLDALAVPLKTSKDDVPMTMDKGEADKENFEIMYRQMRKQFDEKSEVLQRTRKELFEVEGKLALMQKEHEQALIEASPEEVELLQTLKLMSAECDDLERQVEGLQLLVASLVEPKKRKRKSFKNVQSRV